VHYLAWTGLSLGPSLSPSLSPWRRHLLLSLVQRFQSSASVFPIPHDLLPAENEIGKPELHPVVYRLSFACIRLECWKASKVGSLSRHKAGQSRTLRGVSLIITFNSGFTHQARRRADQVSEVTVAVFGGRSIHVLNDHLIQWVLTKFPLSLHILIIST
jgi:hypothetical protein